jgi:mannose/cellobiose epimerase-like protein (N-acyl-D-glucosamine 2-epimerase family)
MVRIRFLTQVLQHHPDPVLRAELGEAVGHVLGPFFHPAHQLTSEALDHERKRPKDANEDFFLLGHAMETMWMILDAVPHLGDPEIEATALERFRSHSEASRDPVRGGFRTAISLSTGPLPGRLLWHHDEALIGNLMRYALTGQSGALEEFFRIDHYTTQTFRVNGRSGPVWALEADDDGHPPATVSRMGNYHLPRRLMLCLEWLDAMKGKQES